MITTLITSPLYADSQLPNLGDPNASYLSKAEQRHYANEFLRGLYQRFTVIDDPLIDSYIHDLGFRLVGSTRYSHGLHFAFFTIVSPIINAMAGPDGNIALTTALILATDYEDELASVLAHEIAHVTQHDFAAGYAHAKKTTPAIIALMLAALAAATQNASVGNGVFAATAAGSAANTLKMQRSQEQAADRIGVQILQQAGYNPHSMVDFFVKLQNNVRYYGDFPGFLSDHPLTSDRIADLTNRTDQVTNPPNKLTLRYALIRERVRIASTNTAKTLFDYYTKKLQKSHDTIEKTALEYGYALALIDARQFAKGKQKLKTLLNTDPDNPIYLVSLAQAYIASTKPEQAIILLKPALALNPDHYPMVVTYAVALEKSKRYLQAISYLRDQLTQFPNYPLLYVILARVQAANHQLANAYQSQVKAFLLIGDQVAALRQLHIALQLPKLSNEQRLVIQAQIRALTPPAK